MRRMREAIQLVKTKKVCVATDSYFGTFVSAESDKEEDRKIELEGNTLLVIIQCRKEVLELSRMLTDFGKIRFVRMLIYVEL